MTSDSPRINSAGQPVPTDEEHKEITEVQADLFKSLPSMTRKHARITQDPADTLLDHLNDYIHSLFRLTRIVTPLDITFPDYAPPDSPTLWAGDDNGPILNLPPTENLSPTENLPPTCTTSQTVEHSKPRKTRQRKRTFTLKDVHSITKCHIRPYRNSKALNVSYTIRLHNGSKKQVHASKIHGYSLSNAVNDYWNNYTRNLTPLQFRAFHEGYA
jgi:hypothetical protein